jgi:drug/metabolite transporter (DMT)-like permease
MSLRLFLVLLGVFSASTSVIWIKLSETAPILLAAYRCLLAGVFLLPVFFLEQRRAGDRFHAGHWKRAIIPGVLLSLHFITWIYGARRTDSANATLIVNFVPIAMPFFLFFLIDERINRKELLGTALATLGVLILGAGDYEFRPQYLIGDALSFVSMLLYAWYLTLGRQNRDYPSIWLYVVPVYLVSGAFSLVVALGVGEWPAAVGLPEGFWILGLALVPTVLGHSLINYGMKYFRGQVVGLLNLGQFISATLLAFFILGEIPVVTFYVAAVLVFTGGTVVILTHGRPD